MAHHAPRLFWHPRAPANPSWKERAGEVAGKTKGGESGRRKERRGVKRMGQKESSRCEPSLGPRRRAAMPLLQPCHRTAGAALATRQPRFTSPPLFAASFRRLFSPPLFSACFRRLFSPPLFATSFRRLLPPPVPCFSSSLSRHFFPPLFLHVALAQTLLACARPLGLHRLG